MRNNNNNLNPFVVFGPDALHPERVEIVFGVFDTLRQAEACSAKVPGSRIERCEDLAVDVSGFDVQ